MAASPTNTHILSLKILLLTTGIVSVAITMNLAVPMMLNFAVTDVPVIWSVIISWLKPPYLYIIINLIIITIVATTRFQQTHAENLSQPLDNSPSVVPPSDLLVEPIGLGYGVAGAQPVVFEPPVVFESKRVVSDVEVVDDALTSTWCQNTSVVVEHSPHGKVQQLPEFAFPVRDKEIVASRVTNNRKPLKATPEGSRELRVLKPKKHETMESTWKMITEGRNMPLTSHLQKSDTFQNRNVGNHSNEPISTIKTKSKVVKKSEIFKDRTNYENENQYLSPSSSTNLSPATSIGKLKKEGSLSHDDLNRRVEAFIKKVNDDMRLQKQLSMNQYMDMVSRGA